MALEISTKQVLQLLNILSWIIFIGLCVESGGILFNTVYAHFNPLVARYFWNNADLSALYARDKGYFFALGAIMSIASVLKALIFYFIVRTFKDKRFDISRPFHPKLAALITRITYSSLGVGLFSYWGARHVDWFENGGIQMPGTDQLRIGGADVWLFMAVVLFVIGYVFKKGTEVQSENDLTV